MLLAGTGWTKARRSSAVGACLQAAYTGESVLVRDSAAPPHSPTLALDTQAWLVFVRWTAANTGGAPRPARRE